MSLSPIWTFTAAVGAPRVAAIEYPLGLNFGAPGDADGQRAVLRAALEVVATAAEPGSVVHLPFEPDERLLALEHFPEENPPIVRAIVRRPWLLRKLLVRDIPGADE